MIRFTIDVEPSEPQRVQHDPAIICRRLLKRLLRDYGLKCLRVTWEEANLVGDAAGDTRDINLDGSRVRVRPQAV